MSKDQKKAVLEEIRSALSEVPEAHHAEVGKAIVHDILVMGKAINIANKRPE
jgi:hypothetical protein